jgi:hypothetical protein
MVRNAIIAAVLGLAAAGCAHATSAGTTAIEPSAAVGDPMRSVAGHWTGTVWETGGSFYQGHTPLDVQINDNGTWRGTVGKSPASGTATFDRRGRLVLSGTAGQDPVRYSLRGNSMERWGEVVGSFQGRQEHASVTLERMQS